MHMSLETRSLVYCHNLQRGYQTRLTITLQYHKGREGIRVTELNLTVIAMS